MNPSDAAFIKGVVAFIVAAAAGISAWRTWLRSRPKGHPDLDPVIQALREEHARLEAELGQRLVELEDRLDFVERRLTQRPDAPRLSQPPAKTPV